MGQGCSGPTDHLETFAVRETGFSIPVRTRRKMGWNRDLPDWRDKVLQFANAKRESLPLFKDLRPAEHFDIYDQGSLGSCTANAIGAAFHFDQVKQGLVEFTPCRLFLYYNERALEGSIEEDAGASIRDGMKTLHNIGICTEGLWPYEEANFAQKPPSTCYKEASKNRAKEYARVPQTLEDMKACINEGFPFVFGFVVYSSFFSRNVTATGNMIMPFPNEYVCGGHAVQACGFDDKRQVFIVRNSWGSGWGDQGYFYMPYEYIANPNLVSDIWAVRFVDGVEFKTRKL